MNTLGINKNMYHHRVHWVLAQHASGFLHCLLRVGQCKALWFGLSSRTAGICSTALCLWYMNMCF